MTMLLQLYNRLLSKPFSRKVLVAPSHAQGHQWLMQISRQYGAVLNTEVRTLDSWILERSRLMLAKRQLRFISSSESRWLVVGLLQELSSDEGGYLSGVALTPGIAHAFHQAVIELREAGVKASELANQQFEQAAKGEFVKELLARYEERLQDGKLIDLSGLIVLAKELPAAREIVFVHPQAVRSAVSKALIDAWADEKLFIIEDEPELVSVDSCFPFGETAFFHAMGTAAEAREVVRRIVHDRLPLDQVEIIASDATNAAAVYTAAAASGLPCTYASGLPIGVTSSGKAALLYVEWLASGFQLEHILTVLKQGVIRFVDDRNEAVSSARMIRELERSGIGWGQERYSLLAKALAKAERELGALEEQETQAGQETQTERVERVEWVEKEQVYQTQRAEPTMQERDRLLERVKVLRLLHKVFKRLLGPLTSEALTSPQAIVHELIHFLESYGVMKEAGDFEVITQLKQLERAMVLRTVHHAQVMHVMQDEHVKHVGNSEQNEHKKHSQIDIHSGQMDQEMQDRDVHSGQSSKELFDAHHVHITPTWNAALALRYVKESLEGLRVQATATPSPGHLHVTALSSGGQSGRPYTFIIGMSEASWSPSLRQDPVLLDEERVRISADLSVSSELAKRLTEERSRRLSMIRGRCTMSFSSYELADQKESMSAYELLQVYRRQTNEPQADYDSLLRAIGNPVRYYSSAARISSDASDVWMQSLLAQSPSLLDGEQAVYAFYPWLKAGRRAQQARLEEAALSFYDGIVDTSRYSVVLPGDEEAEEGLAFSASRLEVYGRCSLQYFYQEVLGVRVKEAAEYNRSQWLDALQRGSLLHEIFNEYLVSMKERRQSETQPEGQHSVQHDEKLLRDITERVIKRYAEEVPAPSEHILRKEADQLRRDVGVFFAGEQRRSTEPVFTELQLHDAGTPFRLKLDDGSVLPIRGFVDRVDLVAPHLYIILDYKTGGLSQYKPNECFAGGTLLQLPLYGQAVEQWMRETGFDAQAEVVGSAYVFPTERGMGEEISRSQNRREDLAAIIRAMMSSMKDGLYPPTDDPNICKWCDYRAVCGSHAERFAMKRIASENEARLSKHQEVIRHG